MVSEDEPWRAPEKGSGFTLQSFCEKQKGFTLQSLTQKFLI